MVAEQLKELREQRAAWAARQAECTAELIRIDAALAEARARRDARAIAGLTTMRQQVQQARDAGQPERARLSARYAGLLATLRQTVDANDAPAEAPLLLLPVRLETRFSADGSALRVRVFPDDVHLDQLERGLAEAEAEAGREYWRRVWRADEAAAAEAWRALIVAVGRTRARWVADALRPVNLATRGEAAAPAFPEPAAPLYAPAEARLLPDHFTVVVIQRDRRVTVTGASLPPEVILGPFARDGRASTTIAGVALAEGAEWIADYAAAERIGLAVTVPLPLPRTRVDRVLAFGVRRSASPGETARDLADLLTAHACSDGLGFVAPGTPTNNTETVRAGWQTRGEPPPPPHDPFTPAEGTNAAVLAAALGVPADCFAAAEQATAADQPLARHAAVALWAATWGMFLERLDGVDERGPRISDADCERARVFARDLVRGRGPLPTLRVGRQPYGVLPVSCLRTRFRAAADDNFADRLLALLRTLRARWLGSTGALPRVGVGPIDAALLEVLGLSPVSTTVRARTVLAGDVAGPAARLSGDAELYEVERLLDQLVWDDLRDTAGPPQQTDALGESVPLALPMTDPARDAAVLGELLADKSPKITSVLQGLVQISWELVARRELSRAGGDRITEVIAGATTLTPMLRERALALATRVLQGQRIPPGMFLGEARNLRRFDPEVADVSLVELQPIAATRKGFGQLALASADPEARSELCGRAVLAWLEAQARAAELRDALGAWIAAMQADPDGEATRVVFAETIDCASHRLDAWLTGLVEQRRRSLARDAGVTVGAFGWVEGVVPDDPKDSQSRGGYIHAPSMAHATTAGILRSAHLSHDPHGERGGLFATDLTSRRARQAAYLLDGIRQGQSLATLLGYAIERSLHAARLDRLIVTLREIAPRADEHDDAEPDAPTESAAGAVVDGVGLIERYQGKRAPWTDEKIRERLAAGPKDTRYLRGPWQGPKPEEWASVGRVIEAAAADLDAVSDLLVAESIHQLAQGNLSRASAALDAAAGEAAAPEPDVIASRIDGVPITHRLVIVAPTTAAAWDPTRPRAAASPQLEAWAAARLGDPRSVIVARLSDGTAWTLADAGLCALDLIYAATDPAGLMQSLRAGASRWPADAPWLAAPDARMAPTQRAIGDVVELAASLRLLLAAARPLTPGDLAVPGHRETRTVAALDACRSRLEAARDGLARATRELAGQIDRPADPAALRAALAPLAAYGLAVTTDGDAGSTTRAALVLAEARRRLDSAEAALARTPAWVDDLLAAGQAVFGDGFWVLPEIHAGEADAWQVAFAAGAVAVDDATLRRFVVDAGSVRDGARRLSEALLLAEAVGRPPTLRIAQLAGAGPTIPDYWVGDPLPSDAASPTSAIASVVLEAPDDLDPDAPICGLLVDHWVETLPIRARRGSAADAPLESRSTTGLAFAAQAAGARAPQAWLLAVSPDGARWTTDALAELLEETLELARVRLVSLEDTLGAARVLPAIYTQSHALQAEPEPEPKSKRRIHRRLDSRAFVKERGHA